jgi:hypothetical protein
MHLQMKGRKEKESTEVKRTGTNALIPGLSILSSSTVTQLNPELYGINGRVLEGRISYEIQSAAPDLECQVTVACKSPLNNNQIISRKGHVLVEEGHYYLGQTQEPKSRNQMVSITRMFSLTNLPSDGSLGSKQLRLISRRHRKKYLITTTFIQRPRATNLGASLMYLSRTP